MKQSKLPRHIPALLTICLTSALALPTAMAALLQDERLYQIESLWRAANGQMYRMCRITSNGALAATKKDKVRVHFEEDEDRLTESQIQTLQEFINQLPSRYLSVDITAHADQCGSHDYNQALALRRGEAVWNVIAPRLDRAAKTTGGVHGETRSDGHEQHDRFVEVQVDSVHKIPFKNIVILDISGSLDPRNPVSRGKTVTGATLSNLKKIKFAPGTLAYVPRDARYACEGTDLAAYTAVGEDFYYDAMMLITANLNGKAKTATWSDDTDINRKRSAQQLSPMALKKGLKWMIY